MIYLNHPSPADRVVFLHPERRDMDAEKLLALVEVLAGIRNELHGIREAMELKDVDEVIKAINDRTKEEGKCPLVL